MFLFCFLAGVIDSAGSVSGVQVLVMVCCVSGGSCDSSNVAVIYRPLDKQASLPQPVNVGQTNRSQSGVWGPTVAPKRLPRGPLSKMREFYLSIISFKMRLPSDQRVESLLSSSHKAITDRPNPFQILWSCFMTTHVD